MAKKEKMKLNLLDCTPLREPDLKWDEDENGIITLHRVFDKRITDKIIHKVTRKPFHSQHITLEEYGSFLWKNMDGRTNLRDLGIKLKDKFGEDCEPLYPRLSKYVTIMKNNNLIFWHLPEKTQTEK